VRDTPHAEALAFVQNSSTSLLQTVSVHDNSGQYNRQCMMYQNGAELRYKVELGPPDLAPVVEHAVAAVTSPHVLYLGQVETALHCTPLQATAEEVDALQTPAPKLTAESMLTQYAIAYPEVLAPSEPYKLVAIVLLGS